MTADGAPFFLHEALAAAQAVTVAANLGVLARLNQSEADVATVARDCAVSERGASVLLKALAGLGVVQASAGGYRLCEQPFSLAELQAFWSDLESAVRTGEPRFSGDVPSDAAVHYRVLAPKLRSLFATIAESFADRIAPPRSSVVDLGAGGAPWSIALARRDPSCRVTAVDLPAVLAETRREVQIAGCTAQFRFAPGDLFEADWAAGSYDLAIAGNLCHLFDERTNQALLSQVFRALRPQGRLAILDVLPREDGDGPRGAVLYALGLLLRTRSGGVYSFSAVDRWLRRAGFTAIERSDLSASPPMTLITAQRP